MEEMDNTDFELAIMSLENNEPKIMARMRAGTFTNIEAGYIVCGIVNCLKDKKNDPIGYLKRMNRVQILIDDIIGEEKIENILSD